MMQLVFSEFQDQLVRGLAHRMNNLLSLFHGYLGLLMDERKLDPVLKEGLLRIRAGATEAGDLMERINAISRPASSNPRELEPADFFRQITPTLDHLRKPHIRMTLDYPEDLEFFRAVFDRHKEEGELSFPKAMRIIESEPWICEINAGVQALYEENIRKAAPVAMKS